MAEANFREVPRTTTLTLLTDWPLSKPNRDLNGDQKAATIGGVRRHVMSSANRKAVWRRVMVPGSLLWLATNKPGFAGTYSMSARTKHVASKLIAGPMLGEVDERLGDHWRMLDEDVAAIRIKLGELGVQGANAQRRCLVELGATVFEILQRTKKRGAENNQDDRGQPEGVSTQEPSAPDAAEADVEADVVEGLGRDTAIAAYGQKEIAEICATLKAEILMARSQAELNGKKLKSKLQGLLKEDQKLEALWELSRLERLGIDGALFGTMVTQHDYRIAAPSAVQVSHSITVHRAFDFETLEIARDDLEDGPQAAILFDASYASGLYATAVTIDHCQLLENVMQPEAGDGGGKWVDRIRFKPWTNAEDKDRKLAADLARGLVISILYASDHAMRSQTNARVYPSYVLAETSAKGGINLLGAFSEAVNERRTNSILSTAISNLRKYSISFDDAYGMAERRAEFVPSPLAQAEKPGGWPAEKLKKVNTAEELADWVAQRVEETRRPER